MRQFPLKVGTETHNFDTDGRVLDAANNIAGTWTTSDDNKILFNHAGGGSDEIAVAWAFNDENQLVVTQGNQTVFVLLETGDGLPRFQLRKNRLVVDPDGDGDFEFSLGCLFGLNADGNLVVSINGKESVLDGFIEDQKSRFRFQFREKGGGSFPNSLVFSGKWEPKGASTEIGLHFLLDDPTLEIAGKPLDMPAVARVDPSRNHLAMVYQSKSHGERRLQFLGSLEIKPGFTLVFRIDDAKDGSTRKSSITIETTFEFDAAKGNLQLFVGKTKTAASQVVEVSGQLQATLKNNVSVDWKFAYTKSTAGGKSTTTIATGVTFEFKAGKIMLNYEKNGKAQHIDITAKIKTSDFDLSFGAEIDKDAQGRKLKAFIGIAF